MDLGTTEAVKKARDAARQARKIASEAKAKAQVGIPSVTSWLACQSLECKPRELDTLLLWLSSTLPTLLVPLDRKLGRSHCLEDGGRQRGQSFPRRPWNGCWEA